MSATALPMAAGSIRWESLPPPWVLVLILLPLGVVLVALAYRREEIPTRQRVVLATIRLATLAAAALMLCGPYLERANTKRVRSHVVVMVDTSASMAVTDEVDPRSAGPLAAATGIPEPALGRTPRLELARRALLEGGDDSALERLRAKFVTHVYSFGAEPRTVWSEDGARDDAAHAGGLPEALNSLQADGPSTRLGDCLMAALEDFRLRDEQLAGIVVVSDGRQTSGSRTPREAAEHARNFLPKGSAGERGVPIVAVTAGDPSSSRNVQVRNLVAPEVVLARDDATFEFDVVEKGFDGETGTLRLMFVDPKGENAVEDNWVDHQIRVVDRKVKVLYVDGRPRREWESLQRALTRDSETMLVHTLQLESAFGVPQPRTDAPGWPQLPDNRFPRTRAELFEYDVVILGDVDPAQLGDTREEAEERLRDLREFVDAGGGLLLIAGEFFMPLEYRRGPLAELMPVIVDPEEVARTRDRSERAFNVALTPEGRESPLFRIDDDAERSRALWETVARWRQWWYFPARRPAAGARVLAVHPEGVDEAKRGEAGYHGNRYGPHVLAAAKPFGLGRTLFLGVEELWRMRYGVGDQYYYAFYAKAIRYLASYRLLGGNRRVKIHPERQVYYLDEAVGLVAHVVGEDYRPPSPAQKPKVSVVVTLPDRTEHAVDLLPLPQPEGEQPLGVYRGTFTPAAAGTYSVAPDRAEVPGEEPESKSFAVQASAEEQRDPSVDEETLKIVAAASGGHSLPLAEVRGAADLLKSRDFRVPVEARPDPLTDHWWVPVVLTLLLAAEWMLRKRWRLL